MSRSYIYLPHQGKDEGGVDGGQRNVSRRDYMGWWLETGLTSKRKYKDEKGNDRGMGEQVLIFKRKKKSLQSILKTF